LGDITKRGFGCEFFEVGVSVQLYRLPYTWWS